MSRLATPPSDVAASPYAGTTATLATKHDKLGLIAPALLETLGMTVRAAEVDTNQLGTFTGDVCRPGDALHTAVAKARPGMLATGSSLGTASEGRFGPLPALPFVTAATELVVLVDDQRGTVVAETVTDFTVITVAADVRPGNASVDLLVRARFPEHELIVRPAGRSAQPIVKGIHDRAVPDQAIRDCASSSPHGLARVETDLRAHDCPTRRPVIAAAAQRLAARLATDCPACTCTGWGIVRVEHDLACRHCGCTVLVPRADVFGCAACATESTEPRPGATPADPRECEWCNP